jgi:glycosyltransferase involved in cell wall biosynthesis
MNKLNFTFGYNTTSFGYHGSYVLKHLTKLGWDVRHIPIGPTAYDPKFQPSNTLFHHKAPSLRLWHPDQMSGHTGSPTIASTNFELEDLNPIQIHNLKFTDSVIVPTKWAQEICRKSGIEAKVVPLGYDEEIFIPTEIKPSDHVTFGNFGKWEIRKGHDVLIKAFNAAFEKDDKVTLVMMPTNPFLKPEQIKVWERMYLGSKLGDKIQIIPRLDSHKDVYNVMSQVTCGVFPARAEGWGLESLEMLGCGKHIIITNCTGHTEYVDSSCRLIEMDDEFESAYDGIFFNGFSRWRKFGQNQFDQLVSHMRDVYNNRTNLTTNLAGAKRAAEFTWEKSVHVLAQEINSCTANKRA